MRIRLTAPQGARARVRYLDSMHGALVNAWTSCGASGTDVVGRDAGNWSFGAVGSATPAGFLMKSLVVGAEGGVLESVLQRLAPETIRKSSANGDIVDLSAWELGRDDLPAVCQPGDFATLGAIMLSPLALSVRGRKGRWHDDLSKAVQSGATAPANWGVARYHRQPRPAERRYGRVRTARPVCIEHRTAPGSPPRGPDRLHANGRARSAGSRSTWTSTATGARAAPRAARLHWTRGRSFVSSRRTRFPSGRESHKH